VLPVLIKWTQGKSAYYQHSEADWRLTVAKYLQLETGKYRYQAWYEHRRDNLERIGALTYDIKEARAAAQAWVDSQRKAA
jgi:hypothetical protein